VTPRKCTFCGKAVKVVRRKYWTEEKCATCDGVHLIGHRAGNLAARAARPGKKGAGKG